MSFIICCVLVVLIALADQLIKLAVLDSSLVDGGVITAIENFLQFRYVENTGAAFSLFEGKTLWLTIFSSVALLVGFYALFVFKSQSKLLLASIVMIMGGGLGNLIDRIRLSFVVDYIETLFIEFPVFNFADCFVTVGSFILVGYLVWDILCDYKKGRSKADGK